MKLLPKPSIFADSRDRPEDHGTAQPVRLLWVACLACSAVMVPGCKFSDFPLLGSLRFSKPNEIALPQQHSVRADQLVVMSDFKLGGDHPLVQDLKLLRQQVTETLELPANTEPVVVFMFKDRSRYRRYMNAEYPGLPFRRAYFIGMPDQLAVYTFWGPRIQEDLRHEYTHGLLHASLRSVPLWLDEGIAEYFEVPGTTPGHVNPDYARKLVTSVQNGWRPDMLRLERLERVEQMHRADYREAWGWVHFLLHTTPDAKAQLIDYLKDLRTNPRPDSLSTILLTQLPEIDTRFLNYIASLNTYRQWLTTSPQHEIADAVDGDEHISRANAP